MRYFVMNSEREDKSNHNFNYIYITNDSITQGNWYKFSGMKINEDLKAKISPDDMNILKDNYTEITKEELFLEML